MSTSGFFLRLFDSMKATVRTPFYLTLVVATAALSLVIVGLTVTSEGASAAGTDGGRMALSFALFLVLIAVLFGVPTVFIGIRDNLGRLPLGHTFLLAFGIGLDYVIAASPALLWAILSTGVPIDVWGPTLGTVLIEVLVVAALVALSHWAIGHHGVAVATAFGLIAAITLGPLLVVATASLGTPVTQTTTTYYVEWKDGGDDIDPVTGYPKDPVCPSPSYSKQQLTDYTGVWAAVMTNPIALLGASITPAVGDYVAPGYQEDGWETSPSGMPTMVLPLDLFSTVDLAVREMQIPIETSITVNECENLEKFGTPYLEPYGQPDPRNVIAESTSGYTFGLIGQGSVVLLSAVILGSLRLRSRRR